MRRERENERVSSRAVGAVYVKRVPFPKGNVGYREGGKIEAREIARARRASPKNLRETVPSFARWVFAGT